MLKHKSLLSRERINLLRRPWQHKLPGPPIKTQTFLAQKEPTQEQSNHLQPAQARKVMKGQAILSAVESSVVHNSQRLTQGQATPLAVAFSETPSLRRVVGRSSVERVLVLQICLEMLNKISFNLQRTPWLLHQRKSSDQRDKPKMHNLLRLQKSTEELLKSMDSKRAKRTELSWHQEQIGGIHRCRIQTRLIRAIRMLEVMPIPRTVSMHNSNQVSLAEVTPLRLHQSTTKKLRRLHLDLVLTGRLKVEWLSQTTLGQPEWIHLISVNNS